MAVLFVFVDGIGLGPRIRETNPFASSRPDLLGLCEGDDLARPLAFDGRFAPLDATMGVAGRPQSATGQTALLTGLNAAVENGGHRMGFTNELLRELLGRHSVLKRLRERGRRVCFANAYRPISFLLPPAVQSRRLSATTVATMAAAVPFRTVAEIELGEALYHDFTNRGLAEEGYRVAPLTPEEAGGRLARLASRHDFAMYEYFQTDKAGHAQDMARGLEVLDQLDRFLRALLVTLDLEHSTVILASDHGNLEDLTHGGHTTNPAMGFAWGREARTVARRLVSVMDVTQAILDLDGSASDASRGGEGRSAALVRDACRHS